MVHHIKYCQRCGCELVSKYVQKVERLYCTKCRHVVYLDPKIAAVVLVCSEKGLLLVKRGIEPHLGRWSLPSGYVDRGENVESAATREVWEEAQLKISLTNLQGIYSGIGPVVLAVYQAEPLEGDPAVGNEVTEVAWFPIDNLPNLPFPHDDRIIQDLKVSISARR